jgi:hypothetical protein
MEKIHSTGLDVRKFTKILDKALSCSEKGGREVGVLESGFRQGHVWGLMRFLILSGLKYTAR